MSEKQDARPLLTVAVPTYNGAKTIRNMLDILLPQVDERVEVLISDNCSTDETPQIVAEYRERYPFIKYARNEENLGADGNFLQCARMAKGKFTMLISDDDIIIENSLLVILAYLEKNEKVSLVFLYTLGFHDHYVDMAHCQTFKQHSKTPKEDICTTDKKLFMEYVGRQWGFTSCFLWATDRFMSIEQPDKFRETYWLQSYVHILCSKNKEDQLGIVATPCIGVGSYGIIGNYDTAKIEGVYFKKMLDYAVSEAGYDQKQLKKLWLWKVCYLAKRAVIKESSIEKPLTSKKLLFDILYPYPYAWIHLFPYLIIPAPVCRFILKIVRKIQGRTFTSYVNRPTEEVKEIDE